jgi:hypothetical protein
MEHEQIVLVGTRDLSDSTFGNRGVGCMRLAACRRQGEYGERLLAALRQAVASMVKAGA